MTRSERWPGAEPGVVDAKPPLSGRAVRSFLWALLGGLIPVPLLGPILALHFAKDGDFDVRSRVPRMRGRGLVRAARVLAYLQIAMFVVGVAFLVWMFAARVIAPPGDR